MLYKLSAAALSFVLISAQVGAQDTMPPGLPDDGPPGSTPVGSVPTESAPPEAVAAADILDIGGTIGDFIITGAKGQITVSPAAADATVIIFVSNQSPASNQYNERMSSLFRNYKAKRVR